MSSCGLVSDLQLKVVTAGQEGYSGLLFLCHATSNKVIVQWTGTDVHYDTKCKIESDIFSLFKVANPEEVSEGIRHPETAVQVNDSRGHEISFPRPGATISRVTAKTEALIRSDCVVGSKNVLVCKHCKQQFKRQKLFRAHVRQHYTRFLCDCGKLSSSRQVLLKHRLLRQCSGNKSGERREMVEVDVHTHEEVCSQRNISAHSKFGTSSVSVRNFQRKKTDAKKQGDGTTDSDIEIKENATHVTDEVKEGEEGEKDSCTIIKVQNPVVSTQNSLQVTSTAPLVSVDSPDNQKNNSSANSLAENSMKQSVPVSSSVQSLTSSRSNKVSHSLASSSQTGPLTTKPPRATKVTNTSHRFSLPRVSRSKPLISSTAIQQRQFPSSTARLVHRSAPPNTHLLRSPYSLSSKRPSTYNQASSSFTPSRTLSNPTLTPAQLRTEPLLGNPILPSPQLSTQPLIRNSAIQPAQLRAQPLIPSPMPELTTLLPQSKPASDHANASFLTSTPLRDRSSYLLGTPFHHLANASNSHRPILAAPQVSRPLLPHPNRLPLTSPPFSSSTVPLLPSPRQRTMTSLEASLLANPLTPQHCNYLRRT